MKVPDEAALFRGETAAELLPLALIEIWPGNPRRTIDAARLQELADSIATAGVLQPILVRPQGAMFGIVLGERRFRAAKMAGLTHIPATVRSLTDAQALEIAVTENLQREDVPPLEEAEGYERLHREFAYSVEDIAHRVGKSRTYVYSRLKLTDLCEYARGFVRAGKITPTVALLIARIPTPSQQAKAAQYCAADHTGQPLTATAARKHIVTHYMTSLNEAIFDPADANLIPAAGACSDCPKRTGSQPELFGDIQSTETCTDSQCYDAKTLRHWARLAEDHAAAGGKVLRGEEAAKVLTFGNHPANGWVSAAHLCPFDNAKRTWADVVALAKRPPKSVLAETSGGRFVELWPEDQALKIAAKLGMKTAPAANDDDPKRGAKKGQSQTEPQVTLKANVRHVLCARLLAAWPRSLTNTEALAWIRHMTYYHGDLDAVDRSAPAEWRSGKSETEQATMLSAAGMDEFARATLALLYEDLNDADLAQIIGEVGIDVESADAE